MTQALADVLAEIDDPETIQEILKLSLEDAGETSPSTQPSLSTLYERYLDRRRNRSPATIAQYKRTIPRFLTFVDHNNATHPDELTPDILDQWVDELLDTYDADATAYTYTKNVRAWLKWIHRRDYCEESIYRILDKKELGLTPAARDEAIPQTEANVLLEKLRTQRFGTAMHALLELTWNTGMRIGEIHSLDLIDFKPSEPEPEITVRHRPDEGTRIKNGRERDDAPGDGERNVIIHPDVVAALSEYIQFERIEISDEFERNPLFTTQHGRTACSTLRRWIYRATSCRWADASDEITCDGQCHPDSNVCPYSYCPHAIRRGAIVSYLSNGLRPDRASGRFDVSPDVIEAHYDPRSKSQRKDDRADAVRNAWANA